MKMNVECLLRDSMKTKPKSNRGARQKTSTPKNVTRMNYNENPYGMSDEVKKAVTDASLNSYIRISMQSISKNSWLISMVLP